MLDYSLPIKDKRLIEYYDTYIKGKFEMALQKPPFVVDLTSDESYNLQELSYMIQNMNVDNIVFQMDDAKAFSDSVINRLPLDAINRMTLRGNLDGLFLPNFIANPDKGPGFARSFENLTALSLEHTGDSPAKIGTLGLPPNCYRLDITNVGKIQNFWTNPNMYSFDHVRLNIDEAGLGIDYSGMYFQDVDVRRVPEDKLDISVLKSKFPNLRMLDTNLPTKPKEYASTRDMLDELKLARQIKGKPGLYDELREEIVSHEDYTVDELLANLVEFSDGTYVDASKFSSVGKDELLDEKLDLHDSRKDEKCLTIQIDSITDLSIEEALKIKELHGDNKNISVVVAGPRGETYCQGAYSIDKYLAIMEKFNELLDGIDMNAPEEEKFSKIYERVSQAIVYDTQAGYPKNEKQKIYSDKMDYSCRNLDALLNGKGVCASYAYILESACKLAGLECQYISGPVDSIEKNSKKQNKYHPAHIIGEFGKHKHVEREYHAWNKVKLNGVWYNVDSTWDRTSLMQGKFPSYALVSDKTLKRTGRIDISGPDCEVDADEATIKRMFPAIKRSSHRDILYEKDVLQYATGEKLSDVKPNFMQKAMKNVGDFFKRRFNSNLTLPAGNPEQINTEGNIILEDTKPIEQEKKKAWELTEDQKKEVMQKQNEVIKNNARSRIEQESRDDTDYLDLE